MRRSAIHGVSQFMITKLSIHARKGNSLRSQETYLEASSIATATATVIPTMGLLPAPMRPIISTENWGTENKKQ